MWCVSSTATTEESPPRFVWVRQHRNEGGRTERLGDVGGKGMMTGEWEGASEFGQCSLNFKEGIEKGDGEGEWRFRGENGERVRMKRGEKGDRRRGREFVRGREVMCQREE